MPEHRRSLQLHRRIVLAGVLATTLVPAGTATAAPGSDSFDGAPPLLFSASGSVNNQSFTTQGAAEPLPSTGDGTPGNPLPACPAMSHTAWWRISGTGQPIRLTTARSDFDTVLAVYDQGGGSPIAGNRIACNDDDGGGSTSALTFSSTRGVSYLVQVGGRINEFGNIDLVASSPTRPGNDDRLAAQVLQTGPPATVSNRGASQELGERLTCGALSYAATIWFRWTAPAIGDAVFSSSAAFGDTVVTVYRSSDGSVVGCDAASVRRVAVRVVPGDYLVQIGSRGVDDAGLRDGPITATADFTLDPDLDNDGILRSSDCNDADPTIRPGIVDIPDDRIDQNCDGVDAINLDRDGDGFNRPGDCNDADPKIHPLAREIPGNRIDEDCVDGAAPFPRVASTVRATFLFKPFRFTSLKIDRAIAGSRIELRCRGGGCFKRRVIRVRKSSKVLSVFGRDIKRARLRRGAVMDVRITMSGHVGVMRRFTVRGATKEPRRKDFCLPVGQGRPESC